MQVDYESCASLSFLLCPDLQSGDSQVLSLSDYSVTNIPHKIFVVKCWIEACRLDLRDCDMEEGFSQRTLVKTPCCS